MEPIGAGLADFELFAGLPPEAIRQIEERCSWHRFVSGDQVFDSESDTLEVYFILEGAVRILMHSGDREIALADVLAGNYFGELAAIDRMKRSARVIATRDSVLASMDGLAFLDCMRAFPEVALKVLERLTRIIRNLDQRVTRLSTQTDNQRICGELVRVAKPDPNKADSWQIPDLPNHKEIASWAGTTREAVAQVIGELARDGIVRRKGMGLVICDWPRLQLLAKAP